MRSILQSRFLVGHLVAEGFQRVVDEIQNSVFFMHKDRPVMFHIPMASPVFQPVAVDRRIQRRKKGVFWTAVHFGIVDVHWESIVFQICGDFQQPCKQALVQICIPILRHKADLPGQPQNVAKMGFRLAVRYSGDKLSAEIESP